MKPIFITTLFVLSAVPCSAIPQQIVLDPTGKVEARAAADKPWVEINQKIRVGKGAEIRTGNDASAELYFSDGSKFSLSNNTQFAVEETTKKKAGFSLLMGKLKASVSGYFASRFEVRTPSAVCAVRGTEFDLNVGDKGATEMNVAEGLVEVNDNKGAMAVVSSEERIKIGENGMSRPEVVSLKDESAQMAARPMAVRQETARERTRTMLEDLRNQELKANEMQLGKDSIDAFGKRVRIEEYFLRPSDREFKVLFLTKREDEGRLDWGHFIERFQNKIPNDVAGISAVIDGMYMSRTMPRNWMNYFEVYLTNTVDSIRETIDFTAPVRIDFAGYNNGTQMLRYYPGSIDYKQFVSGPGVNGGVGEKQLFQQLQDFNVTTPTQFTWTQKVRDNTDSLSTLLQVTMDPASQIDAGTYTSVIIDRTGIYNDAYGEPGSFDDPTINPVTIGPTYTNGADKADMYVRTDYQNGSWISSRKIQVENDGTIVSLANPANSSTFMKEGSYNLEMVVESSYFQGRKIDVLFAPEILSQKSIATKTADNLTPQ